MNLEPLRHSTAHLLAAAVLKLYPGTKLGIGPVIENGFYYDFDLPKPINEVELSQLEREMTNIAAKNLDFEHFFYAPAQAKIWATGNKQTYKLDLIGELIKANKKLSFYKTGSFIDLCEGPHVKNTSQLKHFKILSTAGAYWRGSEKNPQLIRIYGTAWNTKQEIDNHLKAQAESGKKDHRRIAAELELYTTADVVGPGLILWLPKGTIIREELEKLGKEIEDEQGYQRVSTPHIAKEQLFKLSGHLPYFADSMYPAMTADEGKYYLKPMNCPHTHLIYKAKKHSYRELPIRYAEYGTVYRYEKSGELFGLLRVRGMTQNDAHIYCTEDQVVDELVKVMKLHVFYYDLFKIKNYYIELALPDFETKKEKYFGNRAAWEKSISILREAATKSGVGVVEKVGEAAFYGPKFDFNIKSAVGREFGLSTNQLDFGSGAKLNLTYIDSQGSEKIMPYIIHRAPLGSDERFAGFLIEHFEGKFPLWSAPVQVTIIPISDKNLKYARSVFQELKNAKIRVELDTRSQTLQAKIRDATLQKVPFMVICGVKEQTADKISVRTREGEVLGSKKLEDFLTELKGKIEKRES